MRATQLLLMSLTCAMMKFTFFFDLQYRPTITLQTGSNEITWWKKKSKTFKDMRLEKVLPISVSLQRKLFKK